MLVRLITSFLKDAIKSDQEAKAFFDQRKEEQHAFSDAE